MQSKKRKNYYYHPNENSTPIPWMRCVMQSEGGLSSHDPVLCCKRNQVAALDKLINVNKVHIVSKKSTSLRIFKYLVHWPQPRHLPEFPTSSSCKSAAALHLS